MGAVKVFVLPNDVKQDIANDKLGTPMLPNEATMRQRASAEKKFSRMLACCTESKTKDNAYDGRRRFTL